jgi:sulfhydrogenase subunit beta (sulfur reductase)
MGYFKFIKEDWDKRLEELTSSHNIFATVANEYGQDYEFIKPVNIGSIVYNKPKPATSLKTFFLPVKENVTSQQDKNPRPRIILGVPNCDIEGLNLLDEIYLDSDFSDIYYRNRRLNTLLISTDCFGIQDHCHCTTYDIRPYASRTADLSAVRMNGSMIFRTITEKGESFISALAGADPVRDDKMIDEIGRKNAETVSLLADKNGELPDNKITGSLIEKSPKEIWLKYSAKCVSCGACTTICPTCTCFLLIDKPGFEKVKQMDACQYPGFERVAGGEDPLLETADRFRNRYMCKYLWKSKKFRSIACTGCGRCIEACIGKINKNELFLELAK